MGKKKKATASNPARGFATTSLPSKFKPTTPPPPEPDPLVPVTAQPEQTPTWQPPTEAELAESELLEIVTDHIPKVRRETQRITNKAETEKRTLRITCYPLRLDRVLGVAHLASTVTGAGSNDKESLGEKILRLAREEYLQQLARTTRRGDSTSKEDKCLLVTGWTLHKVLMALGFPRHRVEEGVKAILSREGAERKDVEALLEEVLEWIAMFCETEEMPKFLDTSAANATLNGAKKGSELQNFVLGITRTDAAIRIKVFLRHLQAVQERVHRCRQMWIRDIFLKTHLRHRLKPVFATTP
jgi:ATP-dependent RNA helicase DHX29